MTHADRYGRKKILIALDLVFVPLLPAGSALFLRRYRKKRQLPLIAERDRLLSFTKRKEPVSLRHLT